MARALLPTLKKHMVGVLEILLILIPISFLLAGGGLVACIWAIKTGQYNDTDSPAQRLVFEDMELNIHKSHLSSSGGDVRNGTTRGEGHL